MSTRTYAVIAATCVAVAARVLAASALLDSPALGVAGLVPLLVLGLARWRWQEEQDTERERPRGGMATPALLHGQALCIAAAAGFVNGKHVMGAVLLPVGLGFVAWSRHLKRRSS